MGYVDIYLPNKPDPDFECYAMVEVPNKDAKGTHWHVLLTEEQYDARKLAALPCATLTDAPDNYKRTKAEVGGDYPSPLHTFGRTHHDPAIWSAVTAELEVQK